MGSNLESNISSAEQAPAAQTSNWARVGIIAAVTALAGGLAVAWWYRKTLTSLHQNGEMVKNTNFGSPEDDPSDEA